MLHDSIASLAADDFAALKLEDPVGIRAVATGGIFFLNLARVVAEHL